MATPSNPNPIENKKMNQDVKVGLFVAFGAGLIMTAIMMLGGADSVFTRTNTFYTHLPTSEGLITGAKVVLSGIPVGVISKVDFEPATKTVCVTMKVVKKQSEWVKKGTTAEIVTQGVLGDKFLSLTPGEMDGPALDNNSEIVTHTSKSFGEMLSRGDELMSSVSSIASSVDRLLKAFESGNRSEIFFQSLAHSAKNFSIASDKLNAELDGMALKKTSHSLAMILDKINSGTGTLGALVNDPSLYEDTRSLIGGANRSKIFRNLVRKTIKDGEAAEK